VISGARDQEPDVVPSRSMVRRFEADQGSLLVRTDFSDDAAWRALVDDATKPYGPDGFVAHFVPVDDRDLEGMGAEELASHAGDAYVVFAADGASMHGSERTLLVVDRLHERGRSFRVKLAEAHAVENNLSLFNMDFFEFVDAVDADGVFRGFRGPEGVTGPG